MSGFKKPEGSKDQVNLLNSWYGFKKKIRLQNTGGSMYAEGNLRTAMRMFLQRK